MQRNIRTTDMNIKSFRKYLAIAVVALALRQCELCCGNEDEDDGICFLNNKTNFTNLNCSQLQCTNDSILLRICLNHRNNDCLKDIRLNLQNKAKWLKVINFEKEVKILAKPNKPIKNETDTSNESCLEFELSNISRLYNETSLDNLFQKYTLLCLKEIHDNAGDTSNQYSRQNNISRLYNETSLNNFFQNYTLICLKEINDNAGNNANQPSNQNNNLELAIGLGITLPIIIISLIILTVYLLKLRSKKTNENVKPTDVEKESSSPATVQSTDETTLCYADLNFNNTNSTISNTERDVEIINYYENRKVVSYYPDSNQNDDGKPDDSYETGTFDKDT